jgi:hypothetical protein
LQQLRRARGAAITDDELLEPHETCFERLFEVAADGVDRDVAALDSVELHIDSAADDLE